MAKAMAHKALDKHSCLNDREADAVDQMRVMASKRISYAELIA